MPKGYSLVYMVNIIINPLLVGKVCSTINVDIDRYVTYKYVEEFTSD